MEKTQSYSLKFGDSPGTLNNHFLTVVSAG